MTLNAELRSMLSSLAPGTELRNGLERILRGRTGALIVLGHDRMIESLCSGGFNLDYINRDELAANQGLEFDKETVDSFPTLRSPPKRPEPATAPPTAWRSRRAFR